MDRDKPLFFTIISLKCVLVSWKCLLGLKLNLIKRLFHNDYRESQFEMVQVKPGFKEI